ncbi:hypothetical protein MA16_Dca011741 [Dendrobium catenatum]|uniref:Reverse transcriptase domain-containing protein n=1 Tax=Dendrobium catenatum TaxID=906689 RepID=A0A2I0WEE0_9ASPA|nr:hypothetical protein MA16_Dca011741 [Dendrobium catenatum]
MPLSIFNRLDIGEIQPSSITLKGVKEDVLIKIDKFIFPFNFIILDMEEDREIPLILGRTFIEIEKVMIDVQK